MRILIACDSFKDALGAPQVCRAIAKGLTAGARPGLSIQEMPLSDGGEGALEILARHLSLASVTVQVSDPLLRPVKASYGLSQDRLSALVEMAEASGLERLSPSERNPLLTSTFGTGELLRHAAGRGARHVFLALGGSATNDAGVGAARALGWRFLDANGREVRPIGQALGAIARIVAPRQPPFDRVEVLCDVTNPLFGPAGAAFTYGRQKGGGDRALALLDDGLRHIALVVERDLGLKGLAEVPGAGAAGGFGFGALAFLNGRLAGGIDLVLDLLGFEQAAKKADLIVTGEGRLDRQSGRGKSIQGVCVRAGGTPVVALCGELALSAQEVRALGLKAAYSINPVEKPLGEMLAATAGNLEQAAAKLLEKERVNRGI